jgi:hypothetical protein
VLWAAIEVLCHDPLDGLPPLPQQNRRCAQDLPEQEALLILVDHAAGESSLSMLESLFRLGVAELPTQTSFFLVDRASMQ